MLISKFRHAILSQNYFSCIHNVNILNRTISGISNDKINVSKIAPTETSVDVSKYYLPEPPIDPELLPKFLDLNHLGEPTFISLGLNSYWPTGWIQYLYEIMHVNAGLPWWATIVASGVMFRIIMSPVSYKIKKLTIINSYVAPKLDELQKKLHSAQVSYNSLTAKLMQDHQKLLSTTGFSPIKSIVYSILQIPVFLSVMIGLKHMAELPVASLKTGGMFWFTDLTMYDPYYILPVSTMILLYFQLELGADVKKNVNSGYMKWGIRCLPIVALAFTCHFPSALLLYWWTSSCMSLVFSGIMSIPIVKTRFGLSMLEYRPKKVVSDSKLGYYENYKESSAEKRIMKLAKQYQDLEHENWVKAGTSTIPKTYKYDPTKVNPVQIN